MTIYSIICLKHGAKYDAEYVNKLYRGVTRNCTLDFNFYCMTDNSDGLDPNIHPIILPDLGPDYNGERRAWWYKPLMFRSNMPYDKTTTLYLDLDLVIIKSIDKILEYMPGQFCICQDFNRHKIPDYHVLNTSVIKFEAGQVSYIYDKFLEWNEAGECVGRLHGDQDFVTKFFECHPEYNRVLWPHDFIMSWKWEILGEATITIKNGVRTTTSSISNLPIDLSIMVFHGRPNPQDEIHHKIIAKNWY